MTLQSYCGRFLGGLEADREVLSRWWLIVFLTHVSVIKICNWHTRAHPPKTCDRRGLVLSTTRPTACVPGARRDPPRGDGGGGRGVD